MKFLIILGALILFTGSAYASSYTVTAIVSYQVPFKNYVGILPNPVGTNYLQGNVLGSNYLNE